MSRYTPQELASIVADAHGQFRVVGALVEDLKAAEAEVARLQKEQQRWFNTAHRLQAETTARAERAEAREAALREALEFYDDPDSFDGGKQAKIALGKLKLAVAEQKPEGKT